MPTLIDQSVDLVSLLGTDLSISDLSTKGTAREVPQPTMSLLDALLHERKTRVEEELERFTNLLNEANAKVGEWELKELSCRQEKERELRKFGVLEKLIEQNEEQLARFNGQEPVQRAGKDPKRILQHPRQGRVSNASKDFLEAWLKAVDGDLTETASTHEIVEASGRPYHAFANWRYTTNSKKNYLEVVELGGRGGLQYLRITHEGRQAMKAFGIEV